MGRIVLTLDGPRRGYIMRDLDGFSWPQTFPHIDDDNNAIRFKEKGWDR
jgi:hypothetical protein